MTTDNQNKAALLVNVPRLVRSFPALCKKDTNKCCALPVGVYNKSTMKNDLETIVSHAIRNGNKIQEGGLGTILPDEKQLKANDRHCELLRKKQEREAAPALAGLDKRSEGGEIRYYDGESRYAIVARSGRVLWFENREGEWFAA